MKFSSNCIAFMCAALVTASPARPAPLQTPDNGVVTQGITTTELDMFKLMSQYAGATYCYNMFRGEPGKMSCSQDKGVCPLVEAANSTNVHPFWVKSVRTAGYIAVDDTNKLIVFTVQGTDVKENPQSLAISLNLDFIKTDLCKDNNKEDGCSIHGGFFLTAQSVKNEIAEVITATVAKHPDYQLVVTGHSLGGGLGAMIATMLRNDGLNVDLYTFGQPKIGGKDISKHIQNQAPAHGKNYRVTHDNDIVPQLPRPDWAPWGHFFPEYYITTKSGDVTEMDISKIDGDFITMKGNEGNSQARGSRHSISFMIGAHKGINAHLDYFGAIAECDSSAPKIPKEHHHHGKHNKHSKAAEKNPA